MSERDFIYWLNGFLENGEPKTLNEEQLKTIRDHLKLVAVKVTPNNYGVTQSTPFNPIIDTKTITC